jgi:hypothetical protein
MRLEDFIQGTEDEKAQFAALIGKATFVFSVNLLKTCYEFQEELPEEMSHRISEMLDWFHSYVGEFLDVETFVRDVSRAIDEEGQNDPAA